VETQIRDCQALVHEVQMEMRRGFQDAHSAYLRVMFRRANPSAAPTEDEAGGSRKRRRNARKLSDFEKEALFQEWVKSSLGTSPDKMDDELVSARALLPLFVTVRMLVQDVQLLKARSNYGQPSVPPLML